jgi:DNA polymerase-3 subunit gamma/tau
VDAPGLAKQVSPERVQLWYQMALLGRRDLGLAPSQRTGFEMALLRMLAFVPANGGDAPIMAATKPVAYRVADAPAPIAAPTTPAPRSSPSTPLALGNAEDWLVLVGNAGLKGPVRELASHCAFLGYEAGVLRLSLPDSCAHLRSDSLVRRLAEELAAGLGSAPQIKFEKAAGDGDTLHTRQQRERNERQSGAEAAFFADPVVGQLLEQGGNVVPDSIRPIRPID